MAVKTYHKSRISTCVAAYNPPLQRIKFKLYISSSLRSRACVRVRAQVQRDTAWKNGSTRLCFQEALKDVGKFGNERQVNLMVIGLLL